MGIGLELPFSEGWTGKYSCFCVEEASGESVRLESRHGELIWSFGDDIVFGFSSGTNVTRLSREYGQRGQMCDKRSMTKKGRRGKQSRQE